MELLYSAEEQPLETAGGIRQALPLLADRETDSFLVVNGDVFTDLSAAALARLELVGEDLAHLLLVDNPPWHAQGDFCLDGAGRVHPRGEGALTFAGISRLRAELFLSLMPGRLSLWPPCCGRPWPGTEWPVLDSRPGGMTSELPSVWPL